MSMHFCRRTSAGANWFKKNCTNKSLLSMHRKIRFPFLFCRGTFSYKMRNAKKDFVQQTNATRKQSSFLGAAASLQLICIFCNLIFSVCYESHPQLDITTLQRHRSLTQVWTDSNCTAGVTAKKQSQRTKIWQWFSTRTLWFWKLGMDVT